MFSCKQTSQRPTIQNVINNYASGGGTGVIDYSNINLTPIYNQLSTLQSKVNLLEISLNNLVIDNNGVPYYVFNDLCNNSIKINIRDNILNSYTLTLPLYNSENSGNFLSIDGCGNLYFSDIVDNNKTQENLTNENYIKNIYNDSSFANNLSLINSINLLKKNEGILINYYQPYNLFNSSRDSTNLYNNIDLYEIDFFVNMLNYINEKNMLTNNSINNKIYKNNNYNITYNIIDNYINNIYRGAFGSKINIYGNYDYIKTIDSIIYYNSLNDNNDVKKYLQFINNNYPNKDISFNEIPKMTHFGMTPPYYFELSGNLGSSIDNSCSIYFNNDISINNINLNLLNFGGMEYEQNIILLKHIYERDSLNKNNIIFYFYEENNYSDFINLFSHDLSSNIVNHIENYKNYKNFIIDNSNIISYNYGSLLFLIDTNNCNILANPNNNDLKTSNNILSALNIDNIYISNYSDLSNNFNNFNNFINNVNNAANINNIYNLNNFNNIQLYNLTDLSDNKLNNYNHINQNIKSNKNNSLILCPLPKNNYIIDTNNNYNSDTNFINDLYKYSSLLQTLYKNNEIYNNNTKFSIIISTNNSNLSNLICFDTSINFLYSEKDLYFTFYDLPNYINNTNNVSLFKNLNINLNNRKFQNGRNNNHTKIIYPFYFDNVNNLLFIDNYINNNINNNFYSSYNKSYNNINNIKNIICRGFIQVILLYIITYLYEKLYKTTNFTKNELLNFYNYLIKNDINNLNSTSESITDLSNSIYLINNLFFESIYNEINSHNYKLYKNDILLENINTNLNNSLRNFIFDKELILTFASKNIKINNINNNNHISYFTLYNINSIISSNSSENNYNLEISDFSNNYLDDNLRYYLLNNWKQYFPNVKNYL